MLDADRMQAVLYRASLVVLQVLGPRFWHRLAMTWNWSNDLEVLYWIVRQKRCDKATALMIFYAGESGYWLDEDRDDGASPAGSSDLNRSICIYVAKRIEADGYRRSRIAFDPSTDDKRSYLAMELKARRLTKPCFNVVPALILPIGGTVSRSKDMEVTSPRALALMDNARNIERRIADQLPAWLRDGADRRAD